MGFKTVTSLDAENTVALGGVNKKTGKKNPTSIEGYYLGSRQVPSTKSKNGLAAIHFFQTSKGNIGVWGKTDLDKKLSQVKLGTMTKVEQSGMKSTKNGDMYMYQVMFDEDNTIEVTGAQDAEASGDEDGGYDSSDDDGGEDEEAVDDDGDSDDDDAQAAAMLAAEERKAKVQAMLNKGKKKVG